MKNTGLFLLLLLMIWGCSPNDTSDTGGVSGTTKQVEFDYTKAVKLSKGALKDKIKGGWAGQVIGCTYGGPTEFRYCGTMIQDYIPIEWDETKIKWWYENAPGLYDDIYMDLTFVEVFEKEGLDAPAIAHANAFANAEYKLWHANQAARYNILNGIEPPASGYWENNPHADDIDFQIEADFAGLMSPGLVNTASEICDKVGHIMNYGDGWYGGVYVAGMYSLAFVSDDMEFIVREALKAIPPESDFYKLMNDVINWYHQYPDDWKKTWFECEKKWSSDIGCPDGVFVPFNIDAKINAAYIIMGLLYGEGDFAKTLDVSTRCGQDSDCNPANAAGILGAMLGHSNIPDYWKQGLEEVEDMDFKYTTISLNDVYEMGYSHATQLIEKNGGEINDDHVVIQAQKPETVKLEKGFENHFPVKRSQVSGKNKLGPGNTEYTLEFKGNGFILGGRSVSQVEGKDYVHELEIYLDGALIETVKLPSNFTTRRHEICWKYNLENIDHTVKLKLLNPAKGVHLALGQLIVYEPI